MTPKRSSLGETINGLRDSAVVVDYGCYGWAICELASTFKRNDLRIIGGDLREPPGKPRNALFVPINPASTIMALPDDTVDLVIANHVIEHSNDPISIFGELVRLTKPAGKIYVEAPSDLAALTLSDPDVEGQGFTNYWDDPTHRRPWPPAALYRLAISYKCKPILCGYVDRDFPEANGQPQPHDCACILAEKPEGHFGKIDYFYITLKGIPRGVEHALALRLALEENEKAISPVANHQPSVPYLK
jgi:SAM-dependent methyltransferase